MAYKQRYLTEVVEKDLGEKIVLISGARQVGKTSISKEIIGKNFKSYAYYNWDDRKSRKSMLNSEWPEDVELIILDEIHKFKRWKTLIKGYYDTLKDKYKFLVTGSAKLDVFRRAGDSLAGRYYHYRLHPFSIAEFCNLKNEPKVFKEINISVDRSSELERLLKFGGFPEPLLKQDMRYLRRWHQSKLDRLIVDDVRSLEQIRDLDSIRLLSDLLPNKAGSLLSLNSLREDLEVSHGSLSRWMMILEKFYYHYRIYPYTNKSIRGLKKEPKLFLWDWSEIDNEGHRFENLVASHLYKLVHYLIDAEGYKAGLHFIRDRDGHEVDFLVTIDKKPWFACEVKLNDDSPSRNLKYFKEKLRIPFAYQISLRSKKRFFSEGVHVLPASQFLAGLI